MNKKRTSILFGAGAVIDWKGPKTSELTKLIRESGFCCIDNQTRITEFIYQTLINNEYSETDINFETIINVIEELIIYYSSFNKDKKTPSLQKVFFDSSFENTLFNFSLEGGKEKHGFKLEIPKNKPYEWQHTGAINGETPAQYFFQLLLADLLTNINTAISKYSYHSKGHTKIISDNNSDINNLFQNWIKKLNPDTTILRLYTLNYDRLFKILGIKSGINEIFEGFDCGETIAACELICANIPRILSDFDCHCHYNLHGSAFWTIEPRDQTQLPNAEIFLQGNPELQVNLSEQPYIQIEKGKSILISNIITGYQKAQKGFLVPYKQMQAAFDRDCIGSNDLYIIGYSFSDEHINMSIKTALKYNPNLKIHIVDPIYNERDGNNGYTHLQGIFIEVFTNYLRNPIPPKKITDACHEYFDGKITVYSMGMNEFLEMQ